jgi:hypothetical protein
MKTSILFTKPNEFPPTLQHMLISNDDIVIELKRLANEGYHCIPLLPNDVTFLKGLLHNIYQPADLVKWFNSEEGRAELRSIIQLSFKVPPSFVTLNTRIEKIVVARYLYFTILYECSDLNSRCIIELYPYFEHAMVLYARKQTRLNMKSSKYKSQIEDVLEYYHITLTPKVQTIYNKKQYARQFPKLVTKQSD